VTDDRAPDEACALCGEEEELVEDPNVSGLYVCRRCLERVAEQNERLARGLDDEPVVEP